MQPEKILILFFFILGSCHSPSTSNFEGYWVMIKADNHELEYKEIDICKDKMVIIMDAEYTLEKDYFIKNNLLTNSNGDFHFKLIGDSDIVVSSKDGSKEFYRKINEPIGEDYYTRNNLVRKYNYYIQSTEPDDSSRINSIKQDMWNYFNRGGFGFLETDQMESEINIEKKD